jgi:hypothetical protein
MSGVVATAIVAHVPTLGLEKNIRTSRRTCPSPSAPWARPCARI